MCLCEVGTFKHVVARNFMLQKVDWFYDILSFSWFSYFIIMPCGPGSSVNIATDYRLDGLGSNPGEDEIFYPSRPALGPTQPPVQWVPGFSQG